MNTPSVYVEAAALGAVGEVLAAATRHTDDPFDIGMLAINLVCEALGLEIKELGYINGVFSSELAEVLMCPPDTAKPAIDAVRTVRHLAAQQATKEGHPTNNTPTPPTTPTAPKEPALRLLKGDNVTPLHPKPPTDAA